MGDESYHRYFFLKRIGYMSGLKIQFSELPTLLPVFPLTGVLLLPRGHLPLNIFEPRYLAMVRDALGSENRLIGMVQPLPQKVADNVDNESQIVSNSPSIYAIGCAGRIIGFNETPEGNNLITLQGVSRFRITDEIEPKNGYRVVQANFSEFKADLSDEQSANFIDRGRLLSAVKKFFEHRNIETEWENLEKAETGRLVTSLAMNIPFSPIERQALLESASTTDLAALLIAMMEMAAAAPTGYGDISH